MRRQIRRRTIRPRSHQVFIPTDAPVRLWCLAMGRLMSFVGAREGLRHRPGAERGGDRLGRLQQRIHDCLADLADFMCPALTILDAYRVLFRNGRGGGSPADASPKKTMIAGTTPEALDAYAAHAWCDLDRHALRYLQLASQRGLGTSDFATVTARFCRIIRVLS